MTPTSDPDEQMTVLVRSPGTSDWRVFGYAHLTPGQREQIMEMLTYRPEDSPRYGSLGDAEES